MNWGGQYILNWTNMIKVFKKIIGISSFIVGIPLIVIGYTLLMIFEWGNKGSKWKNILKISLRG